METPCGSCGRTRTGVPFDWSWARRRAWQIATAIGGWWRSNCKTERGKLERSPLCRTQNAPRDHSGPEQSGRDEEQRLAQLICRFPLMRSLRQRPSRNGDRWVYWDLRYLPGASPAGSQARFLQSRHVVTWRMLQVHRRDRWRSTIVAARCRRARPLHAKDPRALLRPTYSPPGHRHLRLGCCTKKVASRSDDDNNRNGANRGFRIQGSRSSRGKVLEFATRTRQSPGKEVALNG
jgi:hypothetical protein